MLNECFKLSQLKSSAHCNSNAPMFTRRTQIRPAEWRRLTLGAVRNNFISLFFFYGTPTSCQSAKSRMFTLALYPHVYMADSCRIVILGNSQGNNEGKREERAKALYSTVESNKKLIASTFMQTAPQLESVLRE